MTKKHNQHIESVAKRLTDALFAQGSSQTPCQRIEFRGGTWTPSRAKEISQGGLCKSAFADWLYGQLVKELVAPSKIWLVADNNAKDSPIAFSNLQAATNYAAQYPTGSREAEDCWIINPEGTEIIESAEVEKTT